MTLPNGLAELLRSCPLPWRIEAGGRHMKLFIGNRMATVFAKCPRTRGMKTGTSRRMLAQVRRVIAESTQQ